MGRINAELQFQPSIRVNTLPFRLSEPYLVLDLACAAQEQVEKLLAEVPGALAACLGEDDWIYALDWQHSGFRYDPRRPVTEHDHWVEDERYGGIFGGRYNAYFPEFYPDGDYYFFVQRDLNGAGWATPGGGRSGSLATRFLTRCPPHWRRWAFQ